MKRNIKRSITMTIIYCMGFGFLALSIGALYPESNLDNVTEVMSKEKELIHVLNETDQDVGVETDMTGKGKALASTVRATPIPTLTPSTTPTPPPVYQLSEGGYPEIEKFFQDYYVAWNSCDYSLIKALTTDPDNAIGLSELQRETRFIDDIRDVTSYIMKSYENNSYIVYVYYEIKYVNIKTPLPRLDKFYLVTDDEGNLKISTCEMDDMLKTYYEERDEDDKVVEIIQMTKDREKDALNNDVDLRVYVEALYGN